VCAYEEEKKMKKKSIKKTIMALILFI